ncbi:MAG: NUDIX hydrolase [Candidatus Woesearchaeota archaeon]
MQEILDIVDKNGKPTGKTISKQEAHAKGIRHRVIHVWMYNDKQDILLQKRAATKQLFPSYWDVAVAGHIDAGEEPIQAALREAQEELGIQLDKNKLRLWRVENEEFHFNNLHENEVYYIYTYKHNQLPTNLQQEEVEQVAYFSKENLPEKKTPHARVWELIFTRIQELESN